MRCVLLVLLSLAVGCGRKPVASTPTDSTGGTASPQLGTAEHPTEVTLHTEKGIAATIEIRRVGRYNRLMVGEVLHGSQVNETFVRHWADDLGFITPGSPWDVLLTVGMTGYFDARQEPLTYYTRTGPLGAIFRELRRRNQGADAKVTVGIIGMKTGTPACYALSGQEFTFYETDAAVKRLVADTSKYFSYIADARKRGAKIDVEVGGRRSNLKSKNAVKYTLLVVDPFDSEEVPVDLLTKEAVQLYFDRMTDGGILALHLSSKPIVFEPMIARVAEELKLTARLWDDFSDTRMEKTWSTWAVLGKNQQALGTLALPMSEQRDKYGTEFRPLKLLPGVPAWRDGSIYVVPGMKR
jgi:hypothetical protein